MTGVITFDWIYVIQFHFMKEISKITLWSPCRFFRTYRPTTVAVRKYENLTILRCCAFSNGKYLLTFLKQDDPLKCRWIFTCRNGVISQKVFAEDLFAAKPLWYIQSPQHNNPQMDVDYFALAFVQYWRHWSVFRLQLLTVMTSVVRTYVWTIVRRNIFNFN